MIAYLVDAFTDRPFTGNPAGVVLDAEGLSEGDRQRIASEFRSAETAFVSRSESADVRLDFHTPTTEVDFCGHATIATFVVLARSGRVKVPDQGCLSLTMETRAGVLPVEISTRERMPYVTMTQRRPQFRALPTDEANFLCMFHLPFEELDDLYPIQLANTGNWHVMVAVRSPKVLDALRVEEGDLARWLRKHGIATVDVFCVLRPGVYECRNFAPGVGVPEDPVTGSAAGALGAYLARIGVLDEGENELEVLQGRHVGRPGKVHVTLDVRGKNAESVRVSGTGVVLYRLTPAEF